MSTVKIRYNCIENDNHLIFVKETLPSERGMPDEVWFGDCLEKSHVIIGFDDLCDALLISCGGEAIVEYLRERVKEVNGLYAESLGRE